MLPDPRSSHGTYAAGPAALIALSLVPLLASCAAAGQTHLEASGVAAADEHGKAAAPLAPPVATDLAAAHDTVRVRIVAAPTRLELLGGVETPVWAYNGSTPGPTLELREGQHVVVRFHNRLPEETTVHWHGLRLPVSADGSPFDPIAPGDSFTYAFTVPQGSAGTYLYHPHPHHRTAWQVGMGLYGAIVIRAEDDPLAHLPERLLVLHDTRFRPDGTFDFPPRDSEQGRLDAENGREGDVVLVNGRPLPELAIRPGETQRWRVVNASAARVYRLALPGHTLLHVGSDGGLFERPVEVDDIVIANTERVELLVRGTGAPGERVVLRSLPYDRYMPMWRPADWDSPLPLAVIRYRAAPRGQATPLPATLRPVPPLDEADAIGTRVVRLGQGRIDGRVMDMERVDGSARLGTTEVWEVRNLVGMDHPFHLHGFPFQVLSRDGQPVAQRSWKDTVNVPKHSTVRLIVRFDRHAGLWMYHCHILEHEDDGMMGILEVR